LAFLFLTFLLSVLYAVFPGFVDVLAVEAGFLVFVGFPVFAGVPAPADIPANAEALLQLEISAAMQPCSYSAALRLWASM
jgi:hypothetical protein